MAHLPISNIVVKSGTSYTIPAGYYAIFKAEPVAQGTMSVQRNGVTIAIASWTQATSDVVIHAPGPITAASGDVISTTHAQGFGVLGLLFPNS